MTVRSTRSTVLFISQVYVPDPAAVGQHLAGAAAELARRGHRVIVFTSARGYYDPALRYSSREARDGVEIRRFAVGGFGKRSIALRILAGLLFLGQAVVHGMLLRRLDTVVVTTSPPMAAIAALIIGVRRRIRVKYWIMDLNPDQVVALGVARPDSMSVRAFEWLNQRILGRADDVVVLDRFMADRVRKKRDVGERLKILPPWPAEDPPEPVAHASNPFRAKHVSDDRIVVMYSGNHGPSNPLTTLLQAAKRVSDDERLRFMFIGGGVGKKEVDETVSPNIVSLPYQPQSELRHSLGAADVHVVTVGDAIPGIVHPSKVYGAMAAGRPILLIGPEENHVADILAEHRIGWHVRHGDVDGAITVLREIAEMPREELAEMGRRAREVMDARGGKAQSVARLCDVLERGV